MAFDITDEELELAPVVHKSNMNCTVVSLVPFALKEYKPQIMPGYFQIPPAKQGKMQCLPVGDSIHWMESPFPGMPPMKMTETSRSMARSIVNDFIEAQLGVDTDVSPGLFWVEGHHDAASIEKNYAPQLEHARKCQQRWFVNLVRMADDDWQQNHQHRCITDIQRYAARALGVDREWISVMVDSQMVSCPLCRDMVRMDAIVHSACGYVMNVPAYESMQGRIVGKESFAVPPQHAPIQKPLKDPFKEIENMQGGAK